jgi:hypothetical protein
LAAKARTAPLKTHNNSSNPDGEDDGRRRSPRLSKDLDSFGQDTTGEVEKATAGTRGRKPVAKKGSSGTNAARAKSTSRSRNNPKSQELETQSGPAECIEQKSRGRSRTSRNESESSAAEPKPSRPAKRSRTHDSEVSEQPARKVAHVPTNDRPKRVTRSHSRSKDASVKATPTLLADEFLQEANHNLVSDPFDPCKYTDGLSVYDTPNRNNVLEAPEYVTDIFHRLFHAEVGLVDRVRSLVSRNLSFSL